MKKYLLRFFTLAIILAVAIAISLPNVTLPFNGKSINIRGIQLTDLGLKWKQKFALDNSFDFVGSKRSVLKLDLTAYNDSKQVEIYNLTRQLLIARLRGAAFQEYDLLGVESPTKGVYYFILTLPLNSERSQVQLLTSKGQLLILGASPSAGSQSQEVGQLDNTDISKAFAIADSNIYIKSQEQGKIAINDFGIKLSVKASSSGKLLSLLSASFGNEDEPIRMILDQSVIGQQTWPQASQPSATSDLMIFTAFGDRANNQLLASVINNGPLPQQLLIENFESLPARWGVDSGRNVFLGMLITLVAVHLLLALYLKRKVLAIVVLNASVSIIYYALLKIFNFPLSVNVLFGIFSGMLFLIELELFVILPQTNIGGDLLWSKINRIAQVVLFIGVIVVITGSYLLPVMLYKTLEATGFALIVIFWILLPLFGRSLFLVLNGNNNAKNK